MLMNIGRQYSRYPSGRTDADATFNGERFRQEYLVPALSRVIADGDVLVVDIDDVRTFGSSFIEEAFAGLIRLRLFDRSEVLSRIEIRCTNPRLMFYKDAIDKSILDARPEAVAATA